ncbi:uncharacterized protein [Amphiura filiformis]|uniref:uncharacterized protein n=1 Tax=Amphiura filiformis TaxID=82378 RepID=UPI003B20D220
MELPFGILLTTAILFLEGINGQSCTNSAEFDTTDEAGIVAATWVPGCTPYFEFCVQMAADGVAELYLSSTRTRTVPYFWISLGWDIDFNAPGDAGNIPYSYIAYCDGTNDCTSAVVDRSDSSSNGDVNENGETCFAVYTTSDSDGTRDGVHVRYANVMNAFISLNELGTNIFDPGAIRYVLLGSHAGDMEFGNQADESASWEICTDNWDSLAVGDDIVTSAATCPAANCDTLINDGKIANDGLCMELTAASNPAYLEIDLGKEMHIVGVTLYNDNTAANLEDAGVYVGSCQATTADHTRLDEIQTNIDCSDPVDNTEATSGDPIFIACPTNTYGQYVYVADTSDAAGALFICEVVVHGKPIADADKTKIAFDSSTYSTTESPGADNTATDMETVTLRRTGSATEFTCSSVDITNLMTGTATEGATDDFQFNSGADLTVTFGKGEATKDATDSLSIIADCDNEGDETVILGLVATPGHPVEACIGSQSTTTITIADDDPIYKFSKFTECVDENVASIKLTIERDLNGITDMPTTIHVSTGNCGGSGTATAGIDYTTLSLEPITFAVGQTSEEVEIFITPDNGNIDLVDEVFCVDLVKTTSMRGDLETPSTVQVTIKNDDTVYSLCDTDFEAFEYEKVIRIQICRDGKVDMPGCVAGFSKSASGVTLATEGVNNDYPPFPSQIFDFAEDETVISVDVPTNDDFMVEEVESFAFEITLPSSACGEDLSPVIHDTLFDTELIIKDDDSLISVTKPTNQVPENAGSMTISFERTVTTQAVTITVKVSGATDSATNVGTSLATETLDFMDTGEHNVTFAIGETTAELVIPIIDDSLIELDENFYVEIIGADSEINQGRKRTVGTILNNDAYFSIQQIERIILESVREFHVVIHRGPLEVNGVYIKPFLDNDITITVNTNSFNGSGAEAGSDFEAVTNKKVTFLGATQDAVKTCVITLKDDQMIEGPEQFFVMITNNNVQINPDRDVATITIEDDDGRITCSIDGEVRVSIEEDEEDPLKITCSRDGINNGDGDDQSLNRVAYIVITAVSESARQGQDFNAFTKRLIFPANIATITETIDDLIIDDRVPEADETFRLDITEPDSDLGETSSAIYITIIDDDVERFGFEDTEYNVGESCGELQVVIVRTSSSVGQGTILRLSASNGAGSNGATYPDDYTTKDVTVQFLANQVQQVVTIDINSDNDDEGAETFTLSLYKVSGSGEVEASSGTATITIQDQIVTYSVQDVVVTRDESSGTQPIVFVRNGDFCRSDFIYVSTRDGTAHSSEDFISFNNRRLTFPGNSNTASVPLTILDDNDEELTETFTVEIQNNNNIIIGSAITTVSVQDDDGRVYFRVSEYRVVEGQGSVTITINRVGNSVTATNVRVQTVGNRGTAFAGSDYTSVTNKFITFEATESSKSISLTILDDNIKEEEETFFVRIIDTTDGVVSEPSEAVITIVDDDDPSGGLSTGAIIGIAAGIGGGVLLLLVIGGLLCLASLRPRRGVPVPRAPPVAYNGPASYPPDYGYRQDYGPPRRVTYYN